jgi:hypothetical protein
MASTESPGEGGTAAASRTPSPAASQAPGGRVAGGLAEWKELLRTEEPRCDRLGIGAAILSIGLRTPDAADNPTDQDVLGEIVAHLEPTDRVCVLRRGEYGVLVVPVADRRTAEQRANELYRSLRGRGWEIGMGWAMRRDGHGLFHAAAQADAAMLRSGSGRLDLSDRA